MPAPKSGGPVGSSNVVIASTAVCASLAFPPDVETPTESFSVFAAAAARASERPSAREWAGASSWAAAFAAWVSDRRCLSNAAFCLPDAPIFCRSATFSPCEMPPPPPPRGVFPPPRGVFASSRSAPGVRLASQARTASPFAYSRARKPPLSSLATLAPAFTSALTHPRCPERAASMSGVRPARHVGSLATRSC